MALQDRTLANTMAKVGMEAKRRRNTEQALAAMQPGVRRQGELPWWANVPTEPSMYRTPEVPGWLQKASRWLRDPGYSREAIVPGASLVDYARTVAEGGRPSIPQTIAAGLDVPLPGFSAAEATLGGLGGLLLGVGARAKAKRPVTRLRGVHYSREPGLAEIDPERAGEGLDALRRAQEAQVGSTRPREAFFYTEGSELARKPEVGLGPHEYRTTGEIEVYDFGKDPLGLRQKQREAWRKKYAGKPWAGEMPENEVREAALNELKDMGYQGYVDPSTGIIATFGKTPVRPAETGPRAWLENVATVSDLPMEPQPGTRGAEYLRAFERRKNRGRMEYVGAPPGVRGPKDIEALVEKYASNIETALDAGVPAGYFYREGTEDIARVTETPEQAAVLAQGIGITSSEAPVASNVDWALRGVEQQSMGLPLRTGMYPGRTRESLTQVAQGEVPDLGVKRGRYAAGLYGGEVGGMDVLAPNDRWEARTVGFKVGEEGKGGISPTNARFIDRVRQEAVRRVNERRGLNLRPLEGQELNWIVERSGASGAAGAMPTIGVDRPTSTIGGALEARTMQHDYPPQFSPVFMDPVTGRDPLIRAMGGQFQEPAVPGTSFSLVSATKGGVDPASEARVRATEGIRGLMTGQGSYAGRIPESATFPRGHEVSGALPGGQRTTTVLEALQAAPALETLAESPQTRAVMGRMLEAGVPDEATRRVLQTWQEEGLAGVRRLVKAGLAPAVVLGILTGKSTSEQTPGGQTGAPAGGGLPNLGV